MDLGPNNLEIRSNSETQSTPTNDKEVCSYYFQISSILSDAFYHLVCKDPNSLIRFIKSVMCIIVFINTPSFHQQMDDNRKSFSCNNP